MCQPARLRTHLTRLLAIALLAPAAWSQTVAYVNMETLFQGYWETARSNSALGKQKDLYVQRATEMAKELDALKTQRDQARERSLNIALSDESRAESRKEAEDKDGQLRQRDKELREFVQAKGRELDGKHLELRNEIVQKLSDYIRGYAEKNQIETVLDVSGLTRNLIPVVVYYPKAKEITDLLLAELNKGHEAELPKPGEGQDAATTPAVPEPTPAPAAEPKPEAPAPAPAPAP